MMVMLKSLFLLVLLPLVAVHATDSLLSPKGVNFEVAALMSVKNKLKDDGLHVLDGWDINSVDPCTWNMVGCSAEGFVISLEMASTGLSGTLSPSIGNLPHLRTMLLQNNYISGPVPPEIGKLSELRTLDLSGNQFVGEIPSSLGFLTRLSYLRLNKNRLSGQIPRGVANLTGLSFLDLSFNNISGPAPRILAKDYRQSCLKLYVHCSLAGNMFLCTSSLQQVCMNTSKPLKDANLSRKSGDQHRWPIAIAVGVICTFMISVALIACWVYWSRWRVHSTSYGIVQVRTLHEEKRLEVLVDRGLNGCFEVEELEKTVELALQCTQSHPNQRPKMSEVVNVLEGIVGQEGNEEEPQGGSIGEGRACSFSRNYNEVHEESSFVIEAIELSGPR
ncbi:hypothetical protein IFM89_028472 [Coptis chinensis]|uniref:Leucine-rich repeat-containing N-terminal plant-type domain-containing protein n=1 Tax=Coptis chinensis TaxID=261450 RepID=A0A835IR62_9MAGN|nr:hypothetical protein IFM89_028472 [Coptis chinensis]